MIKLGINPLTWSNDDLPSLGGDIPLTQCLEEAAQVGFQGIELGNKFPRDATQLAPLLYEYGLELISGWHSGNLLTHSVESEIAALQPHLKLLQALNCKVFIYAETTQAMHQMQSLGLSHRPLLSLQERHNFYQKLNDVADYLQTQDVHLSFHHHMGTYFQSFEEIAHLISNTNKSVGLLLDTGHLSYAGISPTQVIHQFGERINHVHCKDIRLNTLSNALKSDSSFLDAVVAGVFTMPGDGYIDFDAVFKALSAISYSGWIVAEAEQNPIQAHPFTYAKMGYDFLSQKITTYF